MTATVSAPAATWCMCWQSYELGCRDSNRCVYRFPSRHPELWADKIHDHVGGDW